MARRIEQAPDGYMTPEAAAEVLKTSSQTIRNRIKGGALAGTELFTGGGEPRYYAERAAVVRIAAAQLGPSNDANDREAFGLEVEEIATRQLQVTEQFFEQAAEDSKELTRAQEELKDAIGEVRSDLNHVVVSATRGLLWPFYIALVLLAVLVLLSALRAFGYVL